MGEGIRALCREHNFEHVSQFVYFAPLHARLMVGEFIKNTCDIKSYTPNIPMTRENHMAMLLDVQAKDRIRSLLGRAKQTQSSSVSMPEQMKGQPRLHEILITLT